eukprot:TRINITY_DN40970_c0_g1_i1.p1 TRINITY_DN40970_c0_g1~~TRINITY_DN40970_c0_g1_i1.p1  ORF type:complete len:255 (-),score=27.18 TRINITY_DN40970_c0_g1_i1:131-844(-)
MSRWKGTLMGILGFGSMVGLGMLVSSNQALKSRAGAFALFMRDNPALGVALHAVLSTAITVSGMPFALVDLGAAWVYPMPVTLCMLLFSKTLGSILCFVIARRVLSEERKKAILAHPTVARVDRLLSGSPIYYGTLFRLALVPAFVKNYGLALLNIEFKRYLACCLLGSLVGVPSQAHLGSKLGGFYLGFTDAEELAQGDPMVLVGAVAPALAMLFLAPTIAKVLLGSDETSDPKAK